MSRLSSTVAGPSSTPGRMCEWRSITTARRAQPYRVHWQRGDAHDEGSPRRDLCGRVLCRHHRGEMDGAARHDLSEGPRRFSELEHSCSGISPRTLSEPFRLVEQEEAVIRR